MSVKQPDPVDIRVAENIRTLRITRNLSQTELAKKLGVTFQQVQKYETGKNRATASRLVAIATTLNVSFDKLFEGARDVKRTARRAA